MKLGFDNSYARLPERFFAPARPTPVEAPAWLQLNLPLAALLGLDGEALASPAGLGIFAGQQLPTDAQPIALAYAGHQFGGFSPQLGDGRAILLGELVGTDGVRRDLQLKGAGMTRFSRRGDGRAALGPVLREYLLSETMAAFGVPTTRALAAVRTGELVYREQPLPGAVLTRVARSHLRVGTFEYFAARNDRAALSELTRFALARHFPEQLEAERPAVALLDRVIEVQAQLVAAWLGLGFVHGVMNTDNTSISGETLDYGPCAFLDTYRPDRRFSSIDEGGRYAYDQQPKIMLWNLTRLAEALLPVLADEPEEVGVALLTERLERFVPRFEAAHAATLRRKLGLLEARDSDLSLARDLLVRLAAGEVDFTLFFRRLAAAVAAPEAEAQVAALFSAPEPYWAWSKRWRQRLAEEAGTSEQRRALMEAANPAFIPRNHQVEAMIEAAIGGDLGPFQRLLAVLARPYQDQPEAADLAGPPGAEQWSYRTFCGT